MRCSQPVPTVPRQRAGLCKRFLPPTDTLLLSAFEVMDGA